MASVWKQRVACPVEGCETTGARCNMGTHLIGGKHQWDREEAWLRVKELPAIEGAPEPPKRHSGRHPDSFESRGMQFVDCPQGCGAVQRRKRIHRHLETVHKIEHRAALRVARNLPVSGAEESVRSHEALSHPGPRHRTKPVPVKILDARTGSQGVDFTGIDPSEIAIAVVQSQVNGTLPSILLPDVVRYVDHTRDLIGKLRDG